MAETHHILLFLITLSIKLFLAKCDHIGRFKCHSVLVDIILCQTTSIYKCSSRVQLFFECNILTFQHFDALTSAHLVLQCLPSKHSLLVQRFQNIISFQFCVACCWISLREVVKLYSDSTAVHCLPYVIQAQIKYFFLKFVFYCCDMVKEHFCLTFNVNCRSFIVNDWGSFYRCILGKDY